MNFLLQCFYVSFMLVARLLCGLSVFSLLKLHLLLLAEEWLVLFSLKRLFAYVSNSVLSNGSLLVHSLFSSLIRLSGVSTVALGVGFWLLSHWIFIIIFKINIISCRIYQKFNNTLCSMRYSPKNVFSSKKGGLKLCVF